jgi:tetratricopeptide (TPR) repeat protein
MISFFGSDRARGLKRLLGALLLVLACVTAWAQQAKPLPGLTPAQRAQVLWEAGYVLHLRGDYEGAIGAFRASIAAHPTAEAHTFLGWSLSYLDKTEEAIAQCKIAIGLDPDFGNPYNDIGVYLINLSRPDEAIPWLEKAIAARRYCCYEFAHYNLGRVLLMQGKLDPARRSFEAALNANPEYLPARFALEFLREGKLQGL